MSNSPGGKREVSFTVNGAPVALQVYPMERLLDVLRRQLRLTGAKEGCGEGECGACSVLMDGALVNTCLIPVGQAQGTNLVTIEGVAADPRFRSVQDAFIDCGGAQCGICTPGMILAAIHLFQKNSNPTLDEIREALSGNICRCTGYQQIFESVTEAARRGASV